MHIDLDGVKKITTCIEQDHGKKLEALLDGYKQSAEQLNRIEKEVSRHEEVILRRVKQVIKLQLKILYHILCFISIIYLGGIL